MIYNNDPSCLFEEWRGERGCGYLCLAFVREVACSARGGWWWRWLWWRWWFIYTALSHLNARGLGLARGGPLTFECERVPVVAREGRGDVPSRVCTQRGRCDNPALLRLHAKRAGAGARAEGWVTWPVHPRCVEGGREEGGGLRGRSLCGWCRESGGEGGGGGDNPAPLHLHAKRAGVGITQPLAFAREEGGGWDNPALPRLHARGWWGGVGNPALPRLHARGWLAG
jgi:hypothetical protein